jgi:hypothetical protein
MYEKNLIFFSVPCLESLVLLICEVLSFEKLKYARFLYNIINIMEQLVIIVPDPELFCL